MSTHITRLLCRLCGPRTAFALSGPVLAAALGCASPNPRSLDIPAPPLPSGPRVGAKADPLIQQASFKQAAAQQSDKAAGTAPAPAAANSLALADLTELTLARNPRLAQVTWAVETARGKALQAGLYLNPIINLTADELNDRTGRGGILGLPYITQEIVTAGKLKLSRAAGDKEADAATLNVVAERYRVLTDVRQAYFDALTLERRVEVLAALVDLSEKAVEQAVKLENAKQAARIDVLQLEVDRERYRAELDATRRSIPAARQKLASTIGVPELPAGPLAGDLDLLPPKHDLAKVNEYALEVSPQVQSAVVGVERAKLLVRRAEVEVVPNVTAGLGYTYQGQNRSSDWAAGVSFPAPIWNRNQGNIRAARAQLGEAVAEVERVRTSVSGQLAVAYTGYTSALARVERYKSTIIPKSRESYILADTAYKAGLFDYIKLVTAQRAVAEANLELIKSQGEMWRAASEIAGLTLEDAWPVPVKAPEKEPAPAPVPK